MVQKQAAGGAFQAAMPCSFARCAACFPTGPPTLLMKNVFSLSMGLLLPTFTSAQFVLSFDTSVPLIEGGNPLSKGWGGGLNFPQVSDIDLDGDGDKDLFLFDRSGNKVVTLRSNAAQGQNTYGFTHDFDAVYPFSQLKEWALLRDYNGDGKEDIFSYSLGGFACYKNTSLNGNLSFALVDTLVRSNYVPTDANLYVTQVDIPGIEDIDGDGDLDVITFSIFGNYMEHHRNLSMELYGTADSLVFEVYNRCWGFFAENLNNNSVYLNSICGYNVPNPQLALQVGDATVADRAHQHHPHTPPGEGERAHTGSTELPIDLDGDGDKDLLVGDILSSTLLALINGGDVDSAYMVAQDSLFPIYDESVQVDIFPAPFYEDVDFDGKRDLLVAPNSESLAENEHSVWYYRNTGTDSSPIFDFQQDDIFQADMLDLGEGAYPVPFDFDGDGLMDLLVGNYGYYVPSGVYPCKIAALRNTGTANAPEFTVVDSDYMGLSASGIGNSMYPAFGDLDGDGDKDMLIGDLQGKLHYFRNDPAGNTAQFTLDEPTIPAVVNGDTIQLDVGMFATPQLFDVDADGTLDLLIGERNGNLNYYRMLDPAPDQLWELVNDSIGGFTVAEYWNVTGYSVPFMYLNSVGQRELVVGSESGWIHQYDGIEGNIDGVWNLVDSTWQDVREGKNTAVALHDFNGDSYLDAVIGNYRGGLGYWRNDFAAAIGNLPDVTNGQAFTLVPNPSMGSTMVSMNIPHRDGLRIEVLDNVGQTVMNGPLRSRRIELDTRDLSPGVYMVRVGDGTNRWTQRLVVMR